MAKAGILRKTVVGWDNLEAALLAGLACDLWVVLVGPHGSCKTKVLKSLAYSLGEKLQIYSAPRDDILTIAGFINHEAAKAGRLEFVEHDRTIWNVEFLAIDELTRAHAENQNLWLEILQEGTLFGQSLNIKRTVVTLNPQATMYSGTFELDKALEDRFTFFLRVPEMQEVESDERSELLNMSLGFHLKGRRSAEKLESLKNTLTEIREHFDKLVEQREDQTQSFVKSYLDWLFSERRVRDLWHPEGDGELYISGRRQGFFLTGLLALTAAREVLYEESFQDAAERAAIDALDYIVLGPQGQSQNADLRQFLVSNLTDMLPLLTSDGGHTDLISKWKFLSLQEKVEAIVSDPEEFLNLDAMWREKAISDLIRTLNENRGITIKALASTKTTPSAFIETLQRLSYPIQARSLAGQLLENWLEFIVTTEKTFTLDPVVNLNDLIPPMVAAIEQGTFSLE